MAGLAAVGLFGVSCSAGGTGTRDAGPGRSDPVAAQADPTPRPTSSVAADAPSGPVVPAARMDPVELLKNDPKVSETVKRDLKPCVKDIYPVDASYGKVTHGASDDVIVNVMTCGDAIGIGSYVFREDNGRYTNVFVAEEPAVYASIDRGDLVVTRPEYKKGDPVEFPSGEVVVTYRWKGQKFVEHDRVANSYSKAVGKGTKQGEEQNPDLDAEEKKRGGTSEPAKVEPSRAAVPDVTPPRQD
ncbi:LppP/LprE family lipoprotein [Streptomyces sp. NBC_00237]|nr:LppP/LprE family lipoprotein [Streptomyces sp. NBC_00237]